VGVLVKGFFDNWEEIFIGAVLQFPLYFVIGWWVLPLMAVCGILWRVGGVTGGVKWARWLIVPSLVCGSAFLVTHSWPVLLAIPFMVKLAPSYGIDSWLFKLTKNDFITRLICYAWYWGAFAVAYTF
jgi:hypothetical protein